MPFFFVRRSCLILIHGVSEIHLHLPPKTNRNFYNSVIALRLIRNIREYNNGFEKIGEVLTDRKHVHRNIEKNTEFQCNDGQSPNRCKIVLKRQTYDALDEY